MVKTESIGRLEQAYRAVVDLESIVAEVASFDEEQARVERLLGQFSTVVRRGQVRRLDQSQP